jgi:hypothetical protein
MVTRAEGALQLDDNPATLPETDDWYELERARCVRYCPCGRPILPGQATLDTTDHLGRELTLHAACA